MFQSLLNHPYDHCIRASMANLICLLLLLVPGCLGWTSAISEDETLPHYYDLKITSHTSRSDFQTAISDLKLLKKELFTLNNSVVFYPG